MLERMLALIGLGLLFLGVLAVLGERFHNRPGFLGRLTTPLASALERRGWRPYLWSAQALFLGALVGTFANDSRAIFANYLNTVVVFSATSVGVVTFLGPLLPGCLTSWVRSQPGRRRYITAQCFVLGYLLVMSW